ncbi:hypothetical protein L198_03445 [Cryptococcus wingfieldii CBS 7118]|uniref:Vacuolar protein sorting-associated protein 51 homolog n=1 Tax=Cryptococcus wingfieldii CBS 7118 TaxID=1295528 RepID=A0A1E3JI61_9TREE|nr:hypothetical protein L198_03445 [Cryptococcus wingfieldii CBS 7118]ODN99601.1 hypothetical protein L198_03445 [Cryptococcus wingfieldii CBS 7118]
MDVETPTRRAQDPSTPTQKRASTPDTGSVRSTIEQRRARREQFRNFYGLKGEGLKGGVPNGDSLDIDSPGFKAGVYYEDLVFRSDLGTLMKAASSLAADIGALQGSRHSLVYNHHHQLFAAGDTISNLNVRTPQLLSVVTNLQQSFSSISQLADSVALPQEIGGGVNNDARRKRQAERCIKRLRLMCEAKAPSQDIAAYLQSVDELLGAAAKDDASIESALKELRGSVPSA